MRNRYGHDPICDHCGDPISNEKGLTVHLSEECAMGRMKCKETRCTPKHVHQKCGSPRNGYERPDIKERT